MAAAAASCCCCCSNAIALGGDAAAAARVITTAALSGRSSTGAVLSHSCSDIYTVLLIYTLLFTLIQLIYNFVIVAVLFAQLNSDIIGVVPQSPALFGLAQHYCLLLTRTRITVTQHNTATVTMQRALTLLLLTLPLIYSLPSGHVVNDTGLSPAESERLHTMVSGLLTPNAAGCGNAAIQLMNFPSTTDLRAIPATGGGRTYYLNPCGTVNYAQW